MARKQPKDRLLLDITPDLRRVDAVMTQILKDRNTWVQFIHDPNGILVRLGLHPPTSPEINHRVNRIFYSILTNTSLLQLVAKHYERLHITKTSLRQRFADGLTKATIDHDVEFDLEGVKHLLEYPKALREIFALGLHDLNNKGLFNKIYSPSQIEGYLNKLMKAIGARRPLSDHPILEQWDRHYGVGKAYGALFAEVGCFVTVAAAAEALAAITVDIYTEVNVPAQAEADTEAANAAEGGPLPPYGVLLRRAAEGDSDSINAISILGRLLDFSAEVIVHAQTFEKESAR